MNFGKDSMSLVWTTFMRGAREITKRKSILPLHPGGVPPPTSLSEPTSKVDTEVAVELASVGPLVETSAVVDVDVPPPLEVELASPELPDPPVLVEVDVVKAAPSPLHAQAIPRRSS